MAASAVVTAPSVMQTGGSGRRTPADTPWLPDEVALLEALNLPLWVFDIDRSRVHWANGAGLQLWQAESLAELSARDMGADMSDTVARRLRQYQQDFERGDARFSEQWTLYPGGQPATMWVGFSGVRLPDGRMAMLCEARPQRHCPPDSLRSVEALLHTEVMTTLFSRGGRALYRNPAARSSVVEGRATLQHRLVDRNDLRTLVRGLVPARPLQAHRARDDHLRRALARPVGAAVP